MATWTEITNGEIDLDSPVTQPLVTALRDNPVAIAEGAAGAPSILEGAIASGAVGAIGTWALLEYTGAGSTVWVQGQTTAGSNLRYAAALGFQSGAGTPAGTWKLHGSIDRGSASSGNKTSLWLRIS